MKLIVLLWLVSAGTLFAKVSAQDMKLDMKVEHKSLIEVMDMLKLKSGFSFIYSAADVENVVGITLDVKEKSIGQILEMVLKNTNLTYVIEDQLIILKRGVPQVKDKQPRILTGVVLGNDRDTLPGVTVLIKGTSVGVVTDVHGRYKITLPGGDHVSLIFSFIGKQSQTIAYTGQKELNVVLVDDLHEMEEVVVTGYQNIDKRKLTSSITTLKAEDIMMPGVTSIDQMLESHVPGMIFMQNSGQVGATPRLRIRGTSTVLGNQEPLWVVDGIVQTDPVNVDPGKINDLDFVNLLGNAISGLNPYDIEDINVLKDASATALYGTKAANGVIVITTKQGKEGPMRVSYHVDGTFKKRPRYSDKSINLMNSKERVDYSREAVDRGLVYPGKTENWVGFEAALEKYNKGEIDFNEFQQQTNRYETLNTDWLGEILQDVFSHNHTLSFSGGSKNVKYYASVAYGRENGVLKKEFGDRYSASVSLSFTQDKFNAQFKLSGNISEREHTPNDVGLLDFAYGTSRAVPKYNEDGSLFYYKRKGTGDNPVYFNVFNERDHSYQTVDQNKLNFTVNMNYKFLKNLRLGTTFSYSLGNTLENVFHGPETAYAAGYANFLGDPRIQKFESSNEEWPFGAELKRDDTRNKSYTLRGQLEYNLFLDEESLHMLSFVGGGEVMSTEYSGLSKTFRGYIPERGLLVSPTDITKNPEYAIWLTGNRDALGILKDRVSNKLGIYGTLTYSFKNTYILNANIRFDFSNEFGKQANDKLLPVWSFSGRWNLKENILANLNWVNDVSLRSSFGYQGNMSPEATPELIITKGELNQAFGEYTSSIKSFPNPDLGWEKTSNFNAALDFALFKNMLKGTLTYYYKKTRNAYLSKKVPQVNGVTNYVVNKGTIENQGFEFSFNIIPINTMVNKLNDMTSTSGEKQGFKWRIDPQLGQVVNKLINKVTRTDKFDPLHDEFKYQDYLNGNAYVTGRPLNSFFSYEFTGLDPTYGFPTFARVGEENFEQYANSPKSKVFTSVMKYSGCRVPYLQGGLSNTFEYRSFVLSFNLAYSIGSKVRLLKLYNEVSNTARTNVLPPIKNMRREFVDRWRKPGDEKHTNIPGLLPGAIYASTVIDASIWWSKESFKFAENIWQMYNNADVRVISGNYLKLQSLNFRYVFPQSLCKKLRVNNLYLSLSGTNLFTWSAKELKGQDPTSQSGSADKINLSVQPTYTFSLDVSF